MKDLPVLSDNYLYMFALWGQCEFFHINRMMTSKK